jgi:GT2 family glycosyltransferase
MAEDAASVAVVVLNWNGAADTIACLASLAAVASPPLDVIVVDNGSSDDSVARIRASRPEVLLLRAGSNLGFAAGTNLGIRNALERGRQRIMILNNDTVVDPRAIAVMCDELDRHPTAGAVCPLLTFRQPGGLVWFAGATFDPYRGRSGRMTGYRRPGGAWVDDLPREIDRGTGAAMLVRREVIDDVGLLDDDFFFLYEDVDWSLRMRAAGWEVRFVPQAHVVHDVAASQGGRELNPDTLYYLVRNQLAVCARHAPLRGLRDARREMIVVAVLLWASRRARPVGHSQAALLAGWRDVHRGRMGRRRIPRER